MDAIQLSKLNDWYLRKNTMENMADSLQKTKKEKILKEFDEKYNENRESFRGTMSLQDSAFVKSFLTTALEEIAQEEYKRGYDEAYAKIPNPCYSQEEVDRLSKVAQQDLEKAKLTWSDIGYRNGVEAAKECVPKDEDGETCDDWGYGFCNCREATLAALNELLTDKS